MAAFEIKLPRPVTGRELLAAAEAASTEGRYHSHETPDHIFWSGQYNYDVINSLLVSGAPTLCEESGIKLDAEYSTVWLLGYKWSLGYAIVDGRTIDEAPRPRFAARILEALSQS